MLYYVISKYAVPWFSQGSGLVIITEEGVSPPNLNRRKVKLMKLLTRCLGLGLAAFLCISAPVTAAAPTPNDIVGVGAVLMDQTTGQILFDKNADQQLYPASTTKILTALIILEDTPLTDVVTIDAETPFVDGSRIYLIEGEQVTVEQLLYAMLLSSANDAAIALAKHHSGTIQAFSRVMNSRAAALGATDSHFVNPNGLPDPEHVSSARDLALIAREAMTHEEFRKIVSTVSYNLPPTNKQPETRHFQNGNRLLYGTGWRNSIVINNQTLDIKWDLVDGIKTGYTTVARQCLVASASQEGRRVIAVTLKSEGKDVYKDVRILLQHGLEDYKNVTLIAKGASLGSLTLADGKTELPVSAAEDRILTVPAQSDITLGTPKLEPDTTITLPVTAGQKIGTAVYTLPEGAVLSVPVLSTVDMDAPMSLSAIKKSGPILLSALSLLLKVLLGGLTLFVLWRAWITWKRVKKRKRLQQLKARAERHQIHKGNER